MRKSTYARCSNVSVMLRFRVADFEFTFMGCKSAYGGSPLANSMAVMPKDQMSALKS
jgi:hypothetical protein